MIEILRDPFWSGVGVIIALITTLAGFFFTHQKRIFLDLIGAIILIIVGMLIGLTNCGSKHGPDMIEDTSVPLESLLAKPWGLIFPEEKETQQFYSSYLFYSDPPANSGYCLNYCLPANVKANQYAAINLPFRKSQDVSEYASLDFTFLATPGAVVIINFLDDARHQDNYKLVGRGSSEMISISLQETLVRCNPKALQSIFVGSGTENQPLGGRFSFSLYKMRFTKMPVRKFAN